MEITKNFMKNKSILITGGTGSLGKALTKRILSKYPEIKKLVIFSRDEQKQFVMSQEFPRTKYPKLRFFIGDILGALSVMLAIWVIFTTLVDTRLIISPDNK